MSDWVQLVFREVIILFSHQSPAASDDIMTLEEVEQEIEDGVVFYGFFILFVMHFLCCEFF